MYRSICLIAAFCLFFFISVGYSYSSSNDANDELEFWIERDSTPPSCIDFPDFTAVQENLGTAPTEVYYAVGGRYYRKATQISLRNANRLGDLIDNYPSAWIEEYVGVEISITDGDERISLQSSSEEITAAQKKLLSAVDIAEDVNILVKYRTKNIVTEKLDDREMKIGFTVIPEKEAEYQKGYEALIDFLRTNSQQEIIDISGKDIPQATIKFTINQNGHTEAIKVKQSSGNTKIDQILLDMIKQLPKWQPALDAEGKAVKQQFELSIGMPGC